MGAQLLHLNLMLHAGNDESKHDDAYHDQAKRPCSEELRAFGRLAALMQIFKELVQSEAEGNERRGRSSPRHEGSFMGKVGSL